MQRVYLYVLAIVLLLAFQQCSDNNDEPTPVEEDKPFLVESNRISSQTAIVLQALAAISGYDIDPELFDYDVDVYQVKYRTTYLDEEVIASGLVVLPKSSTPVGMISYQHGTIVKQSEAPSVQSGTSIDVILYGAIASLGYVAAIPDYIGFGNTKDIFHPYYVEEPTAQAVIDIIKAAKELAKEKSVTFNEKLFLAGYSQGGYATMAAHKAIEANPIDGVNLVASFPAAGGFALKEVQEYLFSLDEYGDPYYFAYLAKAYQSYYNKSELLTDFFNEPYASRIPNLINGSNSAGQIDAQLTTRIPDLITQGIRLGIDSQSKYKYIADLIKENSLTDWKPVSKMFLYHGDVDETVPYENSVLTYEQLISNGASSENLQLITLAGKGHSSGVEPYVKDFLEKITALR